MSLILWILQIVILMFCVVALIYMFNDKFSIRLKVLYLIVFLVLLIATVGGIYLRMNWGL